MTSAYYIGLMSGTSLDGVDAALIEMTSAQKITLKSFVSVPLPAQLQTSLQALNLTPKITLKSFCELQVQVAQVFIEAAQTLLSQAQLSPNDIQAIGSHGQTIFHDPSIPMSLQIGHPAFIAKQTGITTVGDFRIDDMALGGQGAPLAPAFHQALFQTEQAIALANIGGIANVSLIAGTQQNTAVKGFDTGPGNGLMDEWCQRHFNQPYDKNGDLAAL
jgi:anhydro-N-acetylmuramic acid kinase